MSQEGILSSNGTGAAVVEFLTGNSGGPVGADALHNIDILGNNSTGIDIVGNAGLSTLTVIGLSSTTTQVGTIATATNVQAAAQTSATVALTPSNITSMFSTIPLPVNQGGSGTNTLTGILIGNGVSPFTASTITQHDVLVGGLSNAITSVAPSATSGVPLISQGAAADPTFGTAVVAGGGTGATTLTAHSLLLGEGTSPITALGVAIDGQIPIGSTGADPVLARLTAGTGISIANGAGSITINGIGGGLTWTDNSGSFTASSNTGYFITTTSTPTLPAAPNEGDVVAFIVDTINICTITGNTGQTIRLGVTVSGAAGTCVSHFRGEAITLVYRSTGTTWIALNSVGTWTVT